MRGEEVSGVAPQHRSRKELAILFLIEPCTLDIEESEACEPCECECVYRKLRDSSSIFSDGGRYGSVLRWLKGFQQVLMGEQAGRYCTAYVARNLFVHTKVVMSIIYVWNRWLYWKEERDPIFN